MVTLIQKHFDNDELADKAVTKILESENKVLQSLIENPLNLTLLCILFEENEGALPMSKTQIMEESILCFIKRDKQRSSKPGDLGMHDDPDLVALRFADLQPSTKQKLLALGKFACDNIRKKQYIFSHSEIQ